MSESPQSKVDICNLALDHCGETHIQDIDSPTSDNEVLIAGWYDLIRKACLREYMWNFANKFRDLSRTGDGEGPFEDAYQLPNDFVRLNGLGEDPRFPIVCRYEISGRNVYATYGDTLPIRYNRDITEIPTMDPLFTQYFSLRLAEVIAYPITKKKSVVDRITDMIAKALPKTVSVDGQEKVPVRVERSKYMRARKRGSSQSSGRYYDFS